MPVTCIVVGCGSRSNRDQVRFFVVPNIVESKYFPHLTDLSKRRREAWLTMIKRADLTESKLKNQRVSSKHFITGKPSALEDINHPDWAPSQNMAHSSLVVMTRKLDLDRKLRVDKRKQVKLSREKIEDEAVPSLVSDEDHDADNGVATQTDLTMEQLNVKLENLKFASEKISTLERKNENSSFGLMDDQDNTGKWICYTGFDYDIVIEVIFKEVEPYAVSTSLTVLSPFNQLLLTLIKLRLNLDYIDIAYHFKVSPTTASLYFVNIIHILYKRLKSLIVWPDRSISSKNIPTCFKDAFLEKITVFVDCFEVFIEKPENYLTQQQCWSNYKHHHTVKFLIVITPQGTMSCISKAWGGRTSDKQIVEQSDFLNRILPGDVVLADRGFLIKESLSILGAKLVIPAFTKGRTHLHPLEVEATKNIAHVRIHIERVIGVIKNKFRIFKGPFPISLLKRGVEPPTNPNTLDKIVTVCCALINILPPIVPL